MAQHTREIASLAKALNAVNVEVVEVNHNRHQRIKIRHISNHGNITLSASPSDSNVMRQRERQIRKELARIGVPNVDAFNWRKV